MGVEGRLGLETVRTHSAEAQLLLAFAQAHCASLSPKRRVAFLKAVAKVFQTWEDQPRTLNGEGLRQARLEAEAVFKDALPDLLE